MNWSAASASGLPIMDEAVAQKVADYAWQDAPFLVLRLDPAGVVREASRFAMRTLGAAIVGRSFATLVVDFRGSWTLEKVSTPNPPPRMLTLSTAQGIPESFSLRFVPLPDGLLVVGGVDVEELLGLQKSVLEQNRELADLGRQLQKANAELKALNQLKNQFLGMAAHDLRKPLGLVLNHAEFVYDEAGEQLLPEHRHFMETIIRSAQRMRRIIDDFLNVAMIEAGNLPLEPHPTTAQQIIDGADELIRLVAEKKGVCLEVDPPPSAILFEADADKLCQVLGNLAGNAIEHSLPGQHVWLSATGDDQWIEFAVRDEGPGIPEADRNRLFEPFERAGVRKTAHERSVGLGLAIARKIVQAHGGRIAVQSTPGEGSTFRFFIPARRR